MKNVDAKTGVDVVVAPKTGVVQVGKRFESYVEGQLISSSYNFRSAEIAVQKKTGHYKDRRHNPNKISAPIKRQSQPASAAFTGEAEKNIIEFVPKDEAENFVPMLKEVPVNMELVNHKFNINERFDFLERATTMVGEGRQASMVVSGAGGLGKSYTVRKALEKLGLCDKTLENTCEGVPPNGAFVFIKGFSTPKAMYRSLYDNNGSVIIFDDCDSVLSNNTAVSILKAALDSYDKRIIDYGSERKSKKEEENPLPNRFEFTGQVIFITNIDSDELDQAIRSRSMVIDVSMKTEEIIERMSQIMKEETFLPD